MRNLRHEVTLRILSELQAGVMPWRQPWSATPGLNTPCNTVTRREYNGVNRTLLLMRSKKWPTLRYLTFLQAGPRTWWPRTQGRARHQDLLC
jgi:antirestriction protein ArdC